MWRVLTLRGQRPWAAAVCGRQYYATRRGGGDDQRDIFSDIIRLARSLPDEALIAAAAEAERRKLAPAPAFKSVLMQPRARRRRPDEDDHSHHVPDASLKASSRPALIGLTSTELDMWMQLWDDYVNDTSFASDAERTHYISSSTRRRVLQTLLDDIQSKPTGIKELIEPWDGAPEALHAKFLSHATRSHSSAIQQYRILKQLADMRLPHQWFPQARAMKRTIVYHAGPTNSGKTFQALEALKSAPRGLYCAPLRLLALEVYDRLSTDGIACSLLTGQERQLTPGETHLSCTIEMSQTSHGRSYDVAVLDEVQMIGDASRGSAWTEALLGIPAETIHVCGDPSAIALIERLCAVTGDDFKLCEYERRSTLSIADTPLPANASALSKGDCIIAFSRRDIYYFKRTIEQLTKHKCAVVYGRLPPETRAAQARLFNDQTSDILIASDAVGMGLNLNIRRVIFSSASKFDGTQERALSAGQIKQIAGRAGRYGSIYPHGHVTAYANPFVPPYTYHVARMSKSDLSVIQRGMRKELEPLMKAGLTFRDAQLQTLSQHNPHLPLSGLMDLMARLAQLDGNYFMCDYEDVKVVADAIEEISTLSFSDRLVFCKAPVNTRSSSVLGHLVQFASQFASNEPVRFSLRPRSHVRDDKDLADLEDFHQVADLYLWLGFRLERFVDSKRTGELREEATALITNALESGIGAQSPRRAKRIVASERREAEDKRIASTLKQYFASQHGVRTASS